MTPLSRNHRVFGNPKWVHRKIITLGIFSLAVNVLALSQGRYSLLFFVLKQGKGFKLPAVPLYPDIGQLTPGHYIAGFITWGDCSLNKSSIKHSQSITELK